MLCYLELYGAPRLLLDNRRSISNPAAQAYFVDAQIDQITRAKFAIYRQIEEGKVSPHLGDLQSHANGPNVLGQKRFFLSDKQSLIPWYGAAFANGPSKHDGSSANPPAASLNGEQSIYSNECVLISPNRDFRGDRLWRKAVLGQTTTRSLARLRARRALSAACAYGSIRTPGLSMPCGSSSRLAARSAAAKSSGRCRSYQGL